MGGTGRFNLAQGLVALAVGVGAGLSHIVSGFIVQAFGYREGFLSLSAVSVAALAFFWIAVPETGGARSPQPPAAA